MTECYRCGASGKNIRFYDVIKIGGILRVCENCYLKEDSPVFRKPTEFQLKEVERKPGVYERLSKMAGINPKERRSEKPLIINEDTNLRKLVDKNYTARVAGNAKPRDDLIDNFHWAIMRARRSKKLTQRQLGEEIGEPEAAVKMAEEGKLPDDGDKLLNKIQNCLRIVLYKEQAKLLEMNKANSAPKTSGFDRKNPDDLRIQDLNQLYKEKEKEQEQEDETEELEKKNQKELSEEEIRDLIFKKR
ncbi:MAG: hypothetical protein WD876_02830 [Candidatus Pacearchaeota archaeon]